MADKNQTFEGDKIKPDIFISGYNGKVQVGNVHLAPSGVVVGEKKDNVK
jgi:hypothetical protein